MNNFIKWIYRAKETKENNNKKAIKVFKREYDNFKNKTFFTSPSFQDLWDIADSIKIIEYIFFEANTKDSLFYSNREEKNSDNINTFQINDKKVIIEFAMHHGVYGGLDNDERITINITRKESNNKTTIKFKNSEWVTEKDEYTEFLLENIISILWENFFRLLDRYVNKYISIYHYIDI